jgi:hypothetical protein
MNSNFFKVFLKPPNLFLWVVTAGMMSYGAPALAVSGFTGIFDPTFFTLTNTNADGLADDTNAATGSLVLVGGNNESLSPGTTTWVSQPLAQSGTISFTTSFAGEPVIYGSGGDRGGYLINGVPTYLVTFDGDSNPVPSLAVTAGQTFGFVVDTADNTGGPGVFFIDNFDFTPAPTPVPLETDALPMLVGLSFLGIGIWFKRRQWQKNNQHSPQSAPPEINHDVNLP